MLEKYNNKANNKMNNKMNKAFTLAAIASVSVANAALTNVIASDATYIRSDQAGINFNG